MEAGGRGGGPPAISVSGPVLQNASVGASRDKAGSRVPIPRDTGLPWAPGVASRALGAPA